MLIRVSELAGEVAGLRKQNNNLQKRVNELTNLNQTSMINLNDELMEEKRKYSSVIEEMNIMKQQLASAQTELKAAVDAKLIAEKKYTDEMLQHTEDIKVRNGVVFTSYDMRFFFWYYEVLLLL